MGSASTIADILGSEDKIFEALSLLGAEVRGKLRYRYMPVDIETFIMSEMYLNLKDSIRPAILQDMKDLFSEPDVFACCKYKEAVFDEAIGSGKSFKTSIIVSYIVHHLICMDCPQSQFGLEPNSMIAIMNMSVNAKQARKVVFGEIKNRMDNSPWFFKHGYNPRIMSELQFENNITIIPGHSGSKFPLGYNLITAVMDEAAFYTDTATNDAAEEIFYTLKRRIQNRFRGHGLMIMISSPRYVDDFIERKAKEAETDPEIFCKRRAIWEVMPEDIEDIQNGKFFENKGVKIPLRYEKDFIKNPDKAWRDLGAQPAETLEAYFKQFIHIEECVDSMMEHPFDEAGNLVPSFEGNPFCYYYVHIDLGLTHDAAGFCMGHYDGENVIIDLLQRTKPPVGGEIDLMDFVRLIQELRRRKFHIIGITYDQFQSAGSIQELRKNGFNAERKSVEGLAPWDTLKEQFYQKKIRMYHYQPLMDELKRLELIQGKKVDHPPKGSKDVADALAGVVHTIIEEGTVKIEAFTG